jgi:very-short-patch-repair endonuclease
MTSPVRATQGALVKAVSRAGGVARTRTMRAQGFSKHHQSRAVDAGDLIRVGRSWLAVPGADALLLDAARDSFVISCVTQAKRLGLWVLNEATTHVGVHPHGRSPGSAHVHWAIPPVPRHPDALVDPIENVLALVAECQPHDPALAIWESALNKGLTTLEAMRRLPLRPAARALCAEAVPWPDSGLESLVPPRLRFLRLPIVLQAWIAGRRVDCLIGERLVLQIDGGTHVGRQRDADNRHDALLKLRGYHVIRVGYDDVVNRWPQVQDLIMRAVAQGLHRAA